MMDKAFRIPPLTKELLTPIEVLAERLKVLIGMPFRLTKKTRTDGSNIRQTIVNVLNQYPLPEPCPSENYQIIPPKRKGVPKILREYLDTYIVTTGSSYNLQVWNRNPAEDSVQVQYREGQPLLANDVRFVFVKVNPDEHVIRSIIILSPDYIVRKFGKFGKPTIKHQLIIPSRTREIILQMDPPVIFHPDHQQFMGKTVKHYDFSNYRIHDEPETGKILSLASLKNLILEKVIGTTVESASTKLRGQYLEAYFASLLGYEHALSDALAGGYPDIRHQMLEVKVQDSPTVDLGKYSPEFEEPVPLYPEFTTKGVRYFIALTDKVTGVIRGAVICPGSELGEHFTYVADKSYKCQRSIPMSFFDRYNGKAVVNP